MPRNGSGTYNLPESPFTPGTVISSAAVNDDFSDIATALTGSVSSDGQTVITGQLKFPSGTVAAPSHTFASELTTGMYLNASGVIGFSSKGSNAFFIDGTKQGTGQTGNQATYGNGAILNPVGSVIDFAGSAAPSGWLLCFGQSLLRTTYPELFTVIGTSFGAVDGTHFTLPDCRGRVGAGVDNMGGSAASRLTATTMAPDGNTLGATGGNQTVTLDSTMIPAHNHPSPAVTDPTHHHTAPTSPVGVTVAGGATNVMIPTGSTQTSDNATGIILAATTGSTGGGLAHANVQPTILFNKIIFAGRP